MTAIHETAYPRLKPNPSRDELEKILSLPVLRSLSWKKTPTIHQQ